MWEKMNYLSEFMEWTSRDKKKICRFSMFAKCKSLKGDLVINEKSYEQYGSKFITGKNAENSF